MTSGDSASDGPGANTASVVPLVPAWRIDRAFDYAVPDSLATSLLPGMLVRVPFGGRRVRGVVTEVGTRTAHAGELSEINAVVFPAPVAPPPQLDLLEWISERYLAPRGRAYGLAVPPRVRIKNRPRPDPAPPVAAATVPLRSSGTDLLEAISSGEAGVWWLQSLPREERGPLIAELVGTAIEARGSSLVAVPEVRYGSEVIDFLSARWPDLARLDSAASEMRRSEGWADLATGARLGVGGRGAVLAPALALRLVVIDEDQHPTYKEERWPRYDARRVAIERARLARAACVFIGSTPSVEVGHLVSTGAARWSGPDRSAVRARRPIVEVVDPTPGRAITHALHERVRDVLRDGGRVALLAPRRGYSRALWCASCRRSVRCPKCEAGLGFDRGTRRLRCPRCGFEGAPPDRCPDCGAVDWRHIGAGSDRLADQVASTWPRSHVVRMDPDVIENADAEEIDSADIYVTTWIGTKPALRPDVRLVGILDADALIRRPDFRSGERAYHAFAEMSEWAGPADEGGRLVIQTAEPRHHAIQATARADYRFFLERELDLRRELDYPPFSELIKITASGPDSRETLDSISGTCRKEGARVLGPIAFTRGDEPKLQILCKCHSAASVAIALRPQIASLPSSVRVAIDVDPR